MKQFLSDSFAAIAMIAVGFFGFKFSWRIAPGLLRGIISMDEDGFRKMGCTLRPVFFLLVVLLTIALGIGSMSVTLKVVENFLPSTLSVKIENFYKSHTSSSIDSK